MGNALSSYNYDADWFSYVRKGRIVVHHGEVDTLLPDNSVRLSDGLVLHNVDAVVACTGWQHTPSFGFGPPGLSKALGMPSTKQDEKH